MESIERVSCVGDMSQSTECSNYYCAVCRGLLSGKFKKGVVPDPSGSRIGWVDANANSRINQAHPSFALYAEKDSFWSLLDSMEAIADSVGWSECSFHFLC